MQAHLQGAILRYRLYDINILINRTLVYVMLTALLASIYIGSIIYLVLDNLSIHMPCLGNSSKCNFIAYVHL
ncbi:MAG: hypothetical protein AUF64_01895 [Chloroflexi bacterium 13_1_20CM_54_36]|nr:MAG: hypothetical protein AUI01_04870 [Ktedonobacter sp. 13_2_20CM_2_56_8]OLD84366.1 MAG: hypothetical protein AUF64_01895 [Chloroflexi bacterium 13_1_20CM_54_36]OLE33970.1 MAG: hypothetical protein AUG45_05890 [Ktedonobacter sp. 13_1_20CM_3_54_15]